jgi:hypothetical protein
MPLNGQLKNGTGEHTMNDLISRQAVIDALVERMGIDWDSLKTLQPALKVIENVPSAKPVKNEPVIDFVDTAEKAAKVEIVSEKDAQATLDNEWMYIWQVYYDDGTCEEIIDPPMTEKGFFEYRARKLKEGKRIIKDWPKLMVGRRISENRP